MSKIVVYHGSSTEVKEPSLKYGRYDAMIVVALGENISAMNQSIENSNYTAK